MTVNFRFLNASNRAGPQISEDLIRAYFGFAGVHDFKFEAAFSGSPTYAPSGTGWKTSWQTTNFPLGYDFLARFTASATPIGLVVAGTPDHNLGYLVGINSSGYPFVSHGKDEAWEDLFVLPTAVTVGGEIMIAYREMAWTESQADRWVAISMWINRRLVMTFVDHVTAYHRITGNATEYEFGLAVEGGSSRTFTGLVVPQLSAFTEWASLDPGEYPAGGLQRAIEGRYIKMFIRYDGSVYAWRPVERSAVDDLDDVDLDERKTAFDRRNAVNHVRMVGAYEEAEYVDYSKGIHRFREEKNPYLMTVQECYREAIKQVQRYLERAKTATAQHDYRPLWEPEDVININGVDYILSSASVSLGVKPDQRSDFRLYVGGE